MAEWTGLEPATPGVTGRYSNQLNYHSNGFWWVLTGSNRRHSPCKGDALPTELSTRIRRLPDPSPLVYRILQTFASSKLWNFCSLDLDVRTRARVPPGTCSTLAYIERAESYQGDRTAFFQRLFHCCHCRIERPACRGLGYLCLLCNLVDEFGFVHLCPLVFVLGTAYSGKPESARDPHHFGPVKLHGLYSSPKITMSRRSAASPCGGFNKKSRPNRPAFCIAKNELSER